ncbi:MAG: carbohydrate kinase family protein [Chloroflexota bacterium]
MDPIFLLLGSLTREFLLPAAGQPRIDAPGGSLLYAAGGLAVWDRRAGLLARVGEDYPRAWLRGIEKRGLDVRGVRVQTGALDVRSFLAYNESFELTRVGPVSQFARRGLPFPKALLGYGNRARVRKDAKKSDPSAPTPQDIPSAYLEAKAAHVCPMNLDGHRQLVEVLRRTINTVTLDPSPAYMQPASLRGLRGLLHGLTAFLPSFEELQSLFWGETNDPWEMCAALGEFGCEYIVVKCGARGQLLYDAVSKRRWEIPAHPSRLADPTGAGDAFCGGFLAGYLKSYDPLEGVIHGNVSASLKVEGIGPFHPLEVMPGLAEARLQIVREYVREV